MIFFKFNDDYMLININKKFLIEILNKILEKKFFLYYNISINVQFFNKE